MAPADDLTRLMLGAAEGDERDAEVLFERVHGELLDLARHRMVNERPGHTLQATALVSEVWLRLVGDAPVAWDSRGHFFSAAAEAMRRILIEHARARGRVKRGGQARRVPLAGIDLSEEVDLDRVLAIDEAINLLEGRDERLAQLVRLRFYAGLSVDETAAALGLSDRTVRREWAVARAFLAKELARTEPTDEGDDGASPR